ncbi:TPA: hypothetical protein DCF80_03440 [Candidatus Saccharibacteria bacterium]|nr:hypothetical protein [Candidatus Saccharibacteria bacterium]
MIAWIVGASCVIGTAVVTQYMYISGIARRNYRYGIAKSAAKYDSSPLELEVPKRRWLFWVLYMSRGYMMYGVIILSAPYLSMNKAFIPWFILLFLVLCIEMYFALRSGEGQ